MLLWKFMRALALTILLWYARHVPYHRGKQKLTEHLRRIFRIFLAGEYVERRGGLWWAMDSGDEAQEDLFWSSAKDVADIREALISMPLEGGVMFDLGANFGYYAIVIATKLRGNCRIYAFEPNPPTMQRFRKNLELNSTSGVYPQEAGLSDAPGDAFIVDQPGHSGASYLHNTLAASGVSPEIPISTLDLFIEQHGIERLDLIKMDIEGAELRALRGGAEALRTFKPAILIELNPDTYERDGYSVRDVVVFLEDMGYEIFTVRPRARITRDHLPAPRTIVNAICRPKES